MISGMGVEVLTPGKTGEVMHIDVIYDENMNEIDSTKHPYMKFFIKPDRELKPGDIIRAL